MVRNKAIPEELINTKAGKILFNKNTTLSIITEGGPIRFGMRVVGKTEARVYLNGKLELIVNCFDSHFENIFYVPAGTHIVNIETSANVQVASYLHEI